MVPPAPHPELVKAPLPRVDRLREQVLPRLPPHPQPTDPPQPFAPTEVREHRIAEVLHDPPVVHEPARYRIVEPHAAPVPLLPRLEQKVPLPPRLP